MSISIQANTPLAEQLSNILQPKLVDVGWSTGGADDSALAEYIVLMLVNGKTQEQIASELSNDLLNLGPEDSGALDFARWLFEQVDVLTNQVNGTAPQGNNTFATPSQTQAIPSFTSESEGNHIAQQDVDMGEGMEASQDTHMSVLTFRKHDGVLTYTRPTGPKSMRNPPRNNNRRLIGQLNKAMDRNHESVLHRVRPQGGSERINMHNRQPPKGPRGTTPQGPRNMGVPSGPSKGPVFNRNQPQMQPMFSQQQQMQLFSLLSTMMSPQQQQQMLATGGAPVPAINPNFRNVNGNHGQNQGKSLFDRVEKNPHRQGGSHHNHRPQQNGNGFLHKQQHQDTEMGDDAGMEVESALKPELSPDTTCKYNLKCTKADCIFAHQSPAAPPGAPFDVHDVCSFGAACQNRKCTGRHPSPAQKKAHQSEQDCKFFPNCTNPHCTFRHPNMPMCRFGADCSREDCKFTHVQTKCKFTPCLNPTCIYKHEEGQRGKYGDKVWKADGNEHLSERKFVSEDGGEELIVAENEQMEGGSSPLAEIIS